MIRSASCGALVHRRDETALKFRAFLPAAKVAARVDAVPQLGVVGKKSQLAAVARLGELLPIADLRKPVDFIDALQDRLAFHLMHFLAAQKIRAALSSARLSDWERNVSAGKERLSGRAAPEAISLPWKPPPAARCESPESGRPAFCPCRCPLRSPRAGAFEKLLRRSWPSPAASAGIRIPDGASRAAPPGPKMPSTVISSDLAAVAFFGMERSVCELLGSKTKITQSAEESHGAGE